jgi:hypothetical protein
VLPQGSSTTASLCSAAPAPLRIRVEVLDQHGAVTDTYEGSVLIDSPDDPSALRTSPLHFTEGVPASRAFDFAPHVAGKIRLIAYDPLRPTVLRDEVFVSVLPITAAGHYYVQQGASGDGSAGAPFGSIGAALAALPAEGARPILHVAPGQYRESLVLRRPVEIVGDSIARTVLLASGAGPAVRIRPEAAGSALRRLTILGAASAALDAAVAIEASSATLTNLLVSGNRNGIRLEDPTGAELRNLTLVNSSIQGLVSRHGNGPSLFASILHGNRECDLYARVPDPPALAARYNLFGLQPCSDMALDDTNKLFVPLYRDPARFLLDPLEQENYTSGAIDGGDTAAAQRDVDGSPNDRGVYGGPCGEVHYRAPQVPAPPRLLLASVLLLGGLLRLGTLRRPRRRNRRLQS